MKYRYGLGLLPLLKEDNSNLETLIIFDSGEITGVQTNGNMQYLLKDHLGSTRLVIGGKDFDYSDFGEPLEGNVRGKCLNKVEYRYISQEWDDELQQYNYLAREYDPKVGRFDSIDPLREGFSPYVYVNNNPINFIDITGEELTPTGKRNFKTSKGENGVIRFYKDESGAFSTAEEDILTNALKESLDILEVNIGLLEGKDRDVAESIDTYFGKGYNPEQIESKLKSIYFGLQNEAFVKGPNKKKIMMMSSPGNRNTPIDVNPKYLEIPQSDVAGNIIHEGSHKYLSTDDHKVGRIFKEEAYGEKNVKELAKLSSSKGIDNADSWKFFTKYNYKRK